MRKNKQLLVFLMIISIVITNLGITAFAESYNEYQIYINDNIVDNSLGKAYMEDGAIMLPLRAVCEELGAYVEYDATLNSVRVRTGNDYIVIGIGKNIVYKNGLSMVISKSLMVKNNRSYIPRDFIEQIFDCKILVSSNTININLRSLKTHYSKGFTIEYLDNKCKLLTDGDGRKLLLVPKGGEKPSNISADAVIEYPIGKAYCASASQVEPIIKYGNASSIKAVSISENDWYFDEMKSQIANGVTKYVGGDMGEPNYELIAAISPEVSFAYTGIFGQQNIIQKLDELGFNYAVNNECFESHFLGRMEWSKFMAAFYDKELEAERELNMAQKQISEIYNKISECDKTKVAWGIYWGGTVYPSSEHSFVGRYINIAKGINPFKDIDVSAGISMEQFYTQCIDADIFVYGSMLSYMPNPTIAGVTEIEPLFEDFKAIKDKNVFVLHNSWFQSINPVSYIEDIAAALHPEAFPNHKFTKLVKLK